MLNIYLLKKRFQHLLMMAGMLIPALGFSQAQIIEVCQLEDFQTPNGHGIFLADLPGGLAPEFLFDSLGGTLTIYSDSSAQLTGRVVHTGVASFEWDVNIWLINRMDFNTWTGLGRGVKIEQAPAAVVNANQQDWTFYELDSSRSILTGVPGATNAGDTLKLAHMPANLDFGFQLGIGSNAKNGNDGISGWFTYSGPYSGHGDVNANKSCSTPTCDITLDSIIVECLPGDTSFQALLFVGGTGTYDISDDQGSPVQQGVSGNYTFGPYSDTLTVSFFASDVQNANCSDTLANISANCSVDSCSVTIDSVLTNCLTDSTFGLVVTISGVGNNFTISDDQGSTSITGLGPGTHPFGEYLNSIDVRVFVTDSSFVDSSGAFTCIDSLGPFTADCTPVCMVGIDTAYTQCATDTTFEVVVIVTGIPGSTDGFTLFNDVGDTLTNISPDTIAFGLHPNGSFINIVVIDEAFGTSCTASWDSLTFVPDSANQVCDTSSTNRAGRIRNFEMNLLSQGVELSWQTMATAPDMQFAMERRTSNSRFEVIDLQQMADMDVTDQDFSFRDYALEVNTHYYYRIKQIRSDGVKTFSSILSHIIMGESEVIFGQVYPNPSNGTANIKLNAVNKHRMSCDLMDIRGAVVSGTIVNTVEGAQEITLPVAGLMPGIYIVRFQLENGQTYVRKLMIRE